MLSDLIAGDVDHFKVLVICEGLLQVLSERISQLVSHQADLSEPRVVYNSLPLEVNQVRLLIKDGVLGLHFRVV